MQIHITEVAKILIDAFIDSALESTILPLLLRQGWQLSIAGILYFLPLSSPSCCGTRVF